MTVTTTTTDALTEAKTETKTETMTTAPATSPPNVDQVLAGILSMPGMHTRALDALLTVSRVEWSLEITTACIECVERPVLRLNPDFVARWCHTPERLTMLVLHELAHVMLGHTRLFPRPTVLHNIAFDAIVNRTVLAMLEGSGAVVHRYAALLTDLYTADTSPEFLLRPPPGWPGQPAWRASLRLPAALRRVHAQLYGSGGAHAGMLTVTYGEIMEALRSTKHDDDADVELLGAHGATPAEREAMNGTRDSHVADVLDTGFDALRGLLPGAGVELARSHIRHAAREPALERALRVLLRRAVHRDGASGAQLTWEPRDVTVVHRLHDRRAACRVHAASLLGAPAPMLFAGRVLERKPAPRGLLIYVDVSGSMDRLLPALRRALRTLRNEIRPRLFWFSTTVIAARPGDLEEGRVPTTGGTSVTAVLQHIMNKVAAGVPVVVLTDGHLESVQRATYRRLLERGTRIHLGVIGGGPLLDGAEWVTTSTRLPTTSETA